MISYWTKLLIPFVVLFLLFGCAGGESSQQENGESANSGEEEMKPAATAEVKNVENESVGTVNFYNHEGKVIVEANMNGLKPGHHGFHIHEKGVCEPDAEEGPFKTAGGHFNPDDQSHAGHAGDMPSLYVNEDGTADFSASFDRLSIDQITETKLAVMVHSNPDNFGNIPDRYQAEGGKTGPDEETMKTGDAGDREACGVITLSEEK
ncbi:superoxide dismutase family protein [Metabacillus arenae]|uniref:Superoxide dismutase [Cu-Zn] n=1 Tax=Metabacillus arenae TaxID=2771434 RepID=A0A926NAB1_9BACI|nr:superoxide dismutase family protein [Metabacillus arenae]MBD1380497.1 superoxide dismutase family protein [Metabacillus arenae]